MSYRTPRYDTDDNGTVDNAEKLEGKSLGNLDSRYVRDQSGTVDTSNIATGAVTSTEIQDGTVAVGDLAFNPATQSELNSHENNSSAHHSRYSDEEAQDAVGTILSGDFSYNDSGNSISLANDSVTVNTGNALGGGGSVALGGSISISVNEGQISHDNISGVSASDHHARYTDEEAQDAVGTILGANFTYNDAGPGISLADDTVTVSSGNALTGGGSVALGGVTTLNVDESAISHDNISGVSSDDHHSRYTDSEALLAVDGSNLTLVNLDMLGGDIESVEGIVPDTGVLDIDLSSNHVKFTSGVSDVFVINPGSGVDAVNEDLYERGNRVATRTWAQNRFGQLNMVTKTANYTASENDGVLADASGGTVTVTLPSPGAGDNVAVKKIDSSSNSVTVEQNGSESIDGSTSITLTEQYEALTLWSDGTDWFIM
jgi:hypothetical protein